MRTQSANKVKKMVPLSLMLNTPIMKNANTILKVFFYFIVLLPFLAAAQQKVYVPKFDLINMPADYGYTFPRLMKSYAEDGNKYILLLADKNDSGVVDAELSRKRAQAKQAEYYVIGELLHVGESILVNMTMYNTSDGTKFWSDKMKASGLDDLDLIAKRMANNMGTVNKASTDGDINGVTNNEQNDLKKKESAYYAGASLGGATALNFTSQGMFTGLGGMLSFDTREFIIDLKGSYYFNNYDRRIGALGMQIFKPLKPQDKTAYLGGGLAMSVVSVPDENPSPLTYGYYQPRTETKGLMLMAGGGYLFNRNSTVNFRASGNLFVALYEVSNKVPAGFFFTLDILWQPKGVGGMGRVIRGIY